jgi:hypothetical protein
MDTTPIVDSEQGTTKTINNVNGVTIVSLPVHIGFGSGAYINNVNTQLWVPNTNGDFNFGTGDFTIDWWENRISDTNSTIVGNLNLQRILSVGDESGDGNLSAKFSSNGSGYDISISLGTTSLNTWTHYAIVRYGNLFTGYKNGNQTGQISSSITIYSAPTSANLQISSDNFHPAYFYGYLDEIRISKGIARWT